MKHLGDITKINGQNVPAVNIVVGGSPCQDLSVAGKREGLAGQRSGLFMEQIRIIKEMRKNDRTNKGADVDIRYIRPRFMVWENVPGAFSSNKGEDFRIVLEETAKIVCEDAVIPRPPKNKWQPSGCIMGDGWSIAWRVHDAQFWGVPQRRKRIALVADFAGGAAPEILFEPKSLYGNPTQSRKEGQGTTEDVERSVGETSAMSTLNNQSVVSIEGNGQRDSHKGDGYKESEIMYTLNTVEQHAVCIENHPADSRVRIADDGIVQTLSSRMGTGGGNVPMILENQTTASFYPQMKAESQCFRDDDISNTLVNGTNPGYQNGIVQVMAMQAIGKYKESEQASALKQRDYQDATDLVVYGVDLYNQTQKEEQTQPIRSTSADADHVPCVYGLDRAAYNQGTNAQYDFRVEQEKIGTQVAKGPGAVCTSVVRRLTPLECERLQGYPDGWTDIGDWVDSKGKTHKGESDSPRYKALGNSIALPFWRWMAKRMVDVLRNEGVDEPTMASLFDGIGGFPLVYSRCGCKPVWASEIEEFPIAVTKIRFPDN